MSHFAPTTSPLPLLRHTCLFSLPPWSKYMITCKSSPVLSGGGKERERPMVVVSCLVQESFDKMWQPKTKIKTEPWGMQLKRGFDTGTSVPVCVSSLNLKYFPICTKEDKYQERSDSSWRYTGNVTVIRVHMTDTSEMVQRLRSLTVRCPGISYDL